MRDCPCAHLHRARVTPDAGSPASSAEAGKVPERTGEGAGPYDVVQSRAGVDGFPPPPPPNWRTGPSAASGAEAGDGEGGGPRTWPNGSARRGDGGGAGRAAQGRVAEAPMSARRVRGRLLRETPRRDWWLM